VYYILNEKEQVIGQISYEPDLKDLKFRGQRAVPEAEISRELKDTYVNRPVRPLEVIRVREPAIVLHTKATDSDGDGLAEVPADGTTKTAFTVEIRDQKGKLTREAVKLLIRTTAGALSAREVTTSNGKASFTLKSSVETVIATVTATAKGFQSGTIALEFIPVPPKTKTARG
jgi:hypothetical protein